MAQQEGALFYYKQNGSLPAASWFQARRQIYYPKGYFGSKSRHYHVLFLTVSLLCIPFPRLSLSLSLFYPTCWPIPKVQCSVGIWLCLRVFSVVADSVIARRAFLSLSNVCLCCRVLPFSSVTSFSFVERIPTPRVEIQFNSAHDPFQDNMIDKKWLFPVKVVGHPVWDNQKSDDFVLISR